jgi:hypothetical protein
MHGYMNVKKPSNYICSFQFTSDILTYLCVHDVKGSTVLKNTFALHVIYKLISMLLLKKDTAPFSELLNNENTLF